MEDIKQLSIFEIVKKSFIYFIKNFNQFASYLAFPIWGQVLGGALALVPSVLLKRTLETAGANTILLVIFILICAVIGLVIFCKAFWEYIVACAALCLDSYELLKGNPSDFEQNHKNIKARAGKYVRLLLIVAGISIAMVVAMGVSIIIPILIPFILIGSLYVFLKLALITQIFALRPDLEPVDIIKESFEVIKGNFWQTFVILCLSGLVYGFIVLLFTLIFAVITFPISIMGQKEFWEIIYNGASTVVSYYFTPYMIIVLTWWYLKINNK